MAERSQITMASKLILTALVTIFIVVMIFDLAGPLEYSRNGKSECEL